MNSKEKFAIFIAKFDCAIKSLRKQDLIPGYSHWNLRVSPATKTYFYNRVAGTSTNPIAVLVDGYKISSQFQDVNIFGNYFERRPTSNYPYYTIASMFGFKANVFTGAFMQGFGNYSTNSNIYERDFMYDHSLAFDTGRFFMHKYFDILLPYTKRDCFDAVR